jgi:hypothetical protein
MVVEEPIEDIVYAILY